MSGDLHVRMLFQADARQARAETLALRDAQAQLAQGAQAAGRAAAATIPQIAGAGTASRATAQQILEAVGATGELASVQQIVRAAIHPMVADYQALQASMREIALAEDIGAISGREAALAHDMLARQASGIVAAMEAAGTAIDGTSAAMVRQDTATQALINQATGVSRATETTIADQLRHGAALDELRARYNPLFAASRQYEAELHAIAEAEHLGAISALEAAAARERAAASLAPMPAQLGQIGAASRTAAAYAGQLAFQLNDIGMMMAMGQSPFMLMIQQGPQVVQVFSQMRAGGLALGPAIGMALRSILNPTALVTMAVIGLGAAAVQWFTAAGEEAVSLTDAVADLSDVTGSYETAVRRALTPMSDLRREYGDQAEAVRSLYLAQADLARLDAMAAMETSISAVTSKFENLHQLVFTLTSMSIDNGPLSGRALAFAKQQVAAIREEFGLTADQATKLDAGLQQLGEASGPQEVGDALAMMREALMSVRDTSGRIPPEINAVAREIATAEVAARKLAGPLAESKYTAEAIAQLDLGAGIRGASADASVLAYNLGIAAGAARALSSVATYQQPNLSFGLPGTPAAIPGGTTALSFGDGKPVLTPPKPTGGVGAGGGGPAAKERREILDLIDAQEQQIRVLLETDPVQKEILKNHEALAEAAPQEAAALEDLIAKRQRLEEIQDRLDEIGDTGEEAFKGLLSGATSFGDALGMILNKLAEMAASDAWDILWGDGGGAGGFGIGNIIGGLLGLDRLADGGRISGPGGPRDDGILTWTSAGEYVVNATATARNLPLIEAINAGAGPRQLLAAMGSQRLADGGMVGASAPAIWRSVDRGATPDGGNAQNGEARLRVYFDKDLNLRGEIERISGRVAADVVLDGISTFSSEILPGRVPGPAAPNLEGLGRCCAQDHPGQGPFGRPHHARNRLGVDGADPVADRQIFGRGDAQARR